MTSNTICTEVVTLEPQGYVTAANVDEFQQQLDRAISSQQHLAVLVDMNRVEFIDSAGIMALIHGFRQARNTGRRFGLCSLNPSVRIIFELTQLDRIFEIYENLEAFRENLIALH